jgi:hypothetical protein
MVDWAVTSGVSPVSEWACPPTATALSDFPPVEASLPELLPLLASRPACLPS